MAQGLVGTNVKLTSPVASHSDSPGLQCIVCGSPIDIPQMYTAD